MDAFGIVSNRLFDVVASGGRAVSDRVAGIDALFGDAVRQVEGSASLRRAVDTLAAARAGDGGARGRKVAKHHSFDARARMLVDAALARLGLAEAPARVAAFGPDAVRVHAIVPFAPHGPQSSAYIRLIAPLTAPGIAEQVELSLGRWDEPVPSCDVCIVQRTALGSIEALNALVRRLAAIDAALVTDLDDAFRLIDHDHPEAAFYQPLNRAPDRALAASAET